MSRKFDSGIPVLCQSRKQGQNEDYQISMKILSPELIAETIFSKNYPRGDGFV